MSPDCTLTSGRIQTSELGAGCFPPNDLAKAHGQGGFGSIGNCRVVLVILVIVVVSIMGTYITERCRVGIHRVSVRAWKEALAHRRGVARMAHARAVLAQGRRRMAVDHGCLQIQGGAR